MKAGMQNEDFDVMRKSLAQLSTKIEIDDPQQGLLVQVKVSGGVFVHPLSREPIDVLRVYAAGSNQVKIIEPSFLRSLPLINIESFTHPSHLCAQIAKQLSAILGQLGQIRDQVAAMGIELDLEHDILRLRGRLMLQDYRLELTIWQPGKLVICKLNNIELPGVVPGPERTLELTGQATADLDQLAKLARGIDDKFRSKIFEDMGSELGVWGQPVTEPPEPTVKKLEPVAETPPAASDPTAQENDQTIAASDQPAVETGQAEGEKNVIEEITAASPDFAKGFSEVLELTEMVEEEEPAPSQPVTEAAPVAPATAEWPPEPEPEKLVPLPVPLEPPATPEPPAPTAEPAPEKFAPQPAPAPIPAAEPSFGPISVESLFEKLGSDARVSAFGGRLRIEVPVKIIQGTYVFYLEQRGPKTFKGYISTPSGARHNVEFDLRAIMELSDVLERVLLGH